MSGRFDDCNQLESWLLGSLAPLERLDDRNQLESWLP